MKIYIEYYADVPAVEREVKYFKISHKVIMLVDNNDEITYLNPMDIQKFTIYDLRAK